MLPMTREDNEFLPDRVGCRTDLTTELAWDPAIQLRDDPVHGNEFSTTHLILFPRPTYYLYRQYLIMS